MTADKKEPDYQRLYEKAMVQLHFLKGCFTGLQFNEAPKEAIHTVLEELYDFIEELESEEKAPVKES
jgi:hypothetical protein